MSSTAQATAKRGLPDRLWPSPNQELLLATVFAPEESARAAWDELRFSFDLDRMEYGSFALMPLLYRRVEAWRLDDPLVPRLRGLYRHAWYRGNVLLERLKEVVRLGAENRINVLVAGEPLLLMRVYEEPGLRPTTRLDLLIRPPEVVRFTRLLEDAGWRRASSRAVWLEHPTGPLAVLQAKNDPQLWQRAEALPGDEAASRTLSLSDQLLSTCTGPGRQQSVNRLQWIADAKFLIDAEPPGLDWNLLCEEAATHRSLLTLRDALSYVSRVAGAAVPDRVLYRLESSQAGRRELLAHRLGSLDGGAHARKLLPPAFRRVLRRFSPAR